MFNEICSVLLVDDEPLPRRILGERVSKIPNTVLAASLSNGESARSFLVDNIVDIVITDIKMPVMDGLELAKSIRALDPCCSVIVTSGYNEFEYAQKAMQCGVQDYLLKPLQLAQVASVIDRGRNSIMRLRERQAIPKLDKFHLLESQIANESFAVWQTAVDTLLSVPGTVVRITLDEAPEYNPHQQIHFVFKNVISDRLPGSFVLFLGKTFPHFDYLIIPPQQSLRHSYPAVLDHLNRVFSLSLQWQILGSVESAGQLVKLMDACREEKTMDAIQVACRYMEQNLHEAISRDEVAAQVYLSSSYFGQLFKKTLGIGYSEYLTNLRIERAKKLLLQKIAIQDVATQVGFRDVKYFSEVFRKKTGMMPTEYRKSSLGRNH